MRSFSKFVSYRLAEDGLEASGDPGNMVPDAPNDPANNFPDQPQVADQGSDDKIMDAMKIALQKYRSHVERFLKKLGDMDPEIRKEIEGNEQAPPLGTSDMGNFDVISPSMADTGGE